ncbi:hypothetical protein SCLCIDRAFT_36097, partial [Scleroderma citrinum Foug A]
LDVVEVARSHSGTALANKFTKVLEDFGVADKVMAKCLIKQFDILHKTGSEDQELYTLAEGLDLEDYEAISLTIDADPDVDDTDNSVDEIAHMDVEDRANLEQQIRPVRMALTKIRKLAFKIINSSTLLLPAWEAASKEVGLRVREIPRDMLTCWNSSFDMADFIVDYHVPVNAMTDKQRLGLGDYALNEHEWRVLEQL